MCKNIPITLLLFVLSASLWAQPITNSSYEMDIETAVNSANGNDYYNAIIYFEKAYKESKDPYLLISIADLAYLLRDYEKAERNYARLLKKDKTGEFNDLKLDMGKTLKSQGKYKESLVYFNDFVSTTDNDSLKAMAENELKGILKLGTYPDNIEVIIKPLDEKLNSGSGESAPAQYVDGTLYYASFNRKTTIVLGEDDEEEAVSKIYAAGRNSNEGYGEPQALKEAINRVGAHHGGVSFSDDGNKMYFVRFQLENNQPTTSQLYISERNENDWSPPRMIENFNGNYVIRDPVEGELFGVKVLFFSSNMPGGYGGYDIYYANKQGDGFGNPVNIGPEINTSYNEETPFYKDGTLYFSSNGHIGMGGYDTYYSTWMGSKWSDVMNMGYNYNTSYDDRYLRFNKSGNAGFLISNRPFTDKKKIKGNDACCDDIFTVQIRDIVIDLQLLVNGENGPLEGATVELFLDRSTKKEDSKTNDTSNNFGFLLDSDKSYKAYITRPGYYPDSISFNTNGVFDDFTVKRSVALKPMPQEEEYETYSANEPIRLNNINFDFDDDKILPEAEDDLSYVLELMEQYPDMVIELSSHTDARGISNYNQKLSQKRADATKKWLENKGIEGNRMKTKGYGETKLLNNCKDGVKCSEEDHRLNRRTEFSIIAGPTSITVQKSRLKKRSE